MLRPVGRNSPTSLDCAADSECEVAAPPPPPPGPGRRDEEEAEDGKLGRDLRVRREELTEEEAEEAWELTPPRVICDNE